ncbi:MAG: hypothetical protein JNL08_06785 [Planctomycetes bacterium]|nr:hypothetical protein [Planctomycetota bacterium]
MQLESHATPPKETPQQRYATLHRAIERGLDSDEVWKELAEVSLRLGHGDEAAACLRRIRNTDLHAALEQRLVRLGVIEDPAARHGLAARRHAGAPAASHAGGQPAPGAAHDEPASTAEHVVDALQYLFHQHMPWLVLVTTLAFPVVVGLGGFLTVGGSPFVLAAIAALPGLSVVAVTGAMGRQILLASSSGSADVPNVPELGQLVRDARRFLLDAALVLGTFFVPSLLAIALGAPVSTTLPTLLVGAFFAPLAWGLRQLRGDYGALSPVTLVRGAARCGLGYAAIVPVCWLLFAPAALAAWGVLGRPIWVQIAAVGPLAVAPLFVVSRLLGTWIDTMRPKLGSVLVGERKAPQPVPVAAAPQAPAAPQPRLPQRPAALEQFAAPKVRPLMVQNRANTGAASVAPKPQSAAPAARPARPATPPAPAQPAAAQRRPAPPQRAASGPSPAAAKTAQPQPAQPQPAQPRPAQPRPAQPASPAAQPKTARPQPAAPARPEPRAIEGRSPRRAPAVSEEIPDLTQLPGAVVLTGSERARHGAAARKT